MVIINNMTFVNEEDFNYHINLISKNIVDLERKQNAIEEEIEVLKNKKMQLIAEYNLQKSNKSAIYKFLTKIFA